MRRRLSKRGGTLVEGALTLLALFIFVFAILEFGRAYNIYQTLTNAAREGARFGVAPCASGAVTCTYGAGNLPTTGDIEAQVQSFLATANITGGTVTVVQDTNATINNVPTTFTTVNVQAPYTFIFFPFGTINLKSKAVMRNENQ